MIRLLLGDCVEQMDSLPPHSIDAVVTDPPYELGFMGQGWDSVGVSFQVRTWNAAHRVLKPGGHLLAFGGTRTVHRIAVAVEDAGFEIRDMVAWMYGSGFPKSMDVAKQIDKRDGTSMAERERDNRAFRFQVWMRRTGLTPQRINEITGTDMGHHLTTHPTQPAVPTAKLFDLLRPMIPKPPEWVEVLVHERTVEVESENFKLREKVGEREMSDTSRVSAGFAGSRFNDEDDVGAKRVVEITRAHTDEARKWEGWGTALKPAFEPVIVARKPLAAKTVAHNVVALGTGAINIDASRIGSGDGGTRDGEESAERRYGDRGSTNFAPTPGPRGGAANGRWPANVILDEEAGALLDDRGGASRFFYCAKSSKSERNAGLDGRDRVSHANHHPTVKPISLMRYLVRLVSPPGGTVLDPFLGSGTTGIAAILEGFEFVGIEREPEYLAIAEARIAHWEAEAERVSEQLTLT